MKHAAIRHGPIHWLKHEWKRLAMTLAAMVATLGLACGTALADMQGIDVSKPSAE